MKRSWISKLLVFLIVFAMVVPTMLAYAEVGVNENDLSVEVQEVQTEDPDGEDPDKVIIEETGTGPAAETEAAEEPAIETEEGQTE